MSATANAKAKSAAKFRQKKAQLLLMQTMASQRRNNGLKMGSQRYRHLVNYVGSPNTLVSLFANPKDISPFVYATPDQLGSLTPMLEFYYSTGDKDKDGNFIPDEKILFSDYIQMADRTVDGRVLAGPQQIKYAEQILLGDRGTLGTNVGVREFSWSFDNKHEGDKTIKASVTIFFGSVRELLNDQFLNFLFVNNTETLKSPEPPKDKVGELEEQVEIASTLAKAYQLMGEEGLTSSKKRFGLDRQRPKVAGMPPDPGSVRPDRSMRTLKAKVGWAVPRTVSGNLDDAFIEAVEATHRVIGLHLVSYSLNFQQEGQVELTIEYVGSLDSILTSEYVSNVLENPNSKDPIEQKRIFISKTMDDSGDKMFEDYAYNGEGPIPQSDGIGKSHRRIATKKGKVNGILLNRIQRFKGESFSISINDLKFEMAILRMHKDYVDRFDKNNEKVKKNLDKGMQAVLAALSQINSKVRHSKYSKFMTNLYTNRRLYYVTVEARNLLKSKTYGGQKRDLKVKGRLKTGEADSEGQKKAATRMKKALEDQAKKERKQEVDAKANVLDPKGDIRISPDANETQTKINLFYFKLGDIIEESLNGMHSFTGIHPRILLGSFNPDIFDLPGVTPTESYPLADLPISSDYFGQWFLEKFVQAEPPVEDISFRRFIDALLNDLVAPLINDAFSSKVKPKMSFNMTTFVSSLDFARGDVIDEAMLQETANAQGSGNGMTSAARHDYFIIYSEQVEKKLEGNFVEDTSKGIYHFMLGSDRGLVKTFAFSEKKMPHLRAQNIEDANQGSALILPQDLELTMFGNTLFRNGQIIYVNADMTLGNAVASKLGLGGYYMVVKSDNSISMADFETVLTCMWQKKPGKG